MHTALASTKNATPKRFVEIADYTRLKAYGFSGQKAAEIVLDAERGDGHAQFFVNAARDEAARAALKATGG